MSTVKFTSTKLKATGKQGTLKSDDSGYYEVVLGGLNAYNSMGEYYIAKGATDLFEKSHMFMRRVANGNLKGELGHPARLPGQSEEAYISMLFRVTESRVCMHIKEVWLDFDYGKNHPELKNPQLVAIMGKIAPSGPHGEALKKSLDNPDENVCFSIRALTMDYYQGGKVTRVLDKIQCWDVVTEPGISISNKYDSPSLESLSDVVITPAKVKTVLEQMTPGVATEDSISFATEVLTAMSNNNVLEDPLYSKW